CLRNKKNCMGVFDELGLICAGCNGCHLNSIQNKAEKLGYTTLVAEGTTVAIGLIEEGTIDAVIGVSCMPVLHRSFVPVTRSAIPGIGIPLLSNGCENTTVDYDWLMEELENYNPESSKTPVSVNQLKNKITDYFNPPVLTDFFQSGSDTEKLAIRMMSRGGHRIRPLLAAIAYQACSTNPSNEVQKHLAIAIECFHKASLIHDDIEDDEAMRYEHPTLHKEHGIPTAINLGDFLVGKGYHLLAGMPVEKTIQADCFRVVSESHIKLSEGQGDDISLPKQIRHKSVEDVIQIFSNKTSEAIKVSLLTGAVAGNAPDKILNILESFSHWFGIAYQIRDDLQEFQLEHRRVKLFDFPFLLILLKEEMELNHENFNEIIDSGNLNDFVEKVDQFNITTKAEKYFHDTVNQCYEELNKLDNNSLRLALHAISGRIFKNL
ncbi:MAG: polyprenyl synthetase family protein, partial [Mariniphaga sp.]|nr:polyprenyl synthetase family protein [Mariniphaga sp.]